MFLPLAVVSGVALLYLAGSACWSVVALCLRVSRKHRTIAFLMLLPFLSAGCGTIVSMRDPPNNRNYVYSGVRLDCWAVFGPDSEFIHPVLKGIGVVDLPFSAAADTICLPYTIPKTIVEKNKGQLSSHTSDGISKPADRLPKLSR